jgi:hypothetical protein
MKPCDHHLKRALFSGVAHKRELAENQLEAWNQDEGSHIDQMGQETGQVAVVLIQREPSNRGGRSRGR